MKRLLLTVNPISGTKNKERLVPKLIERLQQMQFEVDCRYTRARGDATKYALQAVEHGYHTVAVCGGDGTVNETARALCGTDVAMAIIPCGSGNGLARHIGLPSDPLASLEIMGQDCITACDYGDVNGTKFFCTFGIGFDAAVTKRFAECGHRGLVSYIRSAFSEFVKYKPRHYAITVNGSTIERNAYLVACCNASQYGNNAYIAPNASIVDGLFDIIIMHDASHMKTLFAGIDMLTGRLPHNSQIEIIRASHVDIHQDETAPAHVDGEPIQMPSDISVDMHHAAIKLYTDPDQKPFVPIVTPVEYMTRDIQIAISKIFK